MTGNQIAYYNARETERWHKATEAETQRHNAEMEYIQTYANMINERNAITNEKMAAETERHNRVNEYLTEIYNKSVIVKNYADAALSTANIDLVKAKTATEQIMPWYYSTHGTYYSASANKINVLLPYEIKELNWAGNLKMAQTFKTYVNIGTDISKEVRAWYTDINNVNIQNKRYELEYWKSNFDATYKYKMYELEKKKMKMKKKERVYD